MKIDIQAVCAQLASATINGVYQGILIALFVGLVLRLLVRTNAATRHAVWFASLVLLASIIPAHYWLDGRAPSLNAQSEGAAAKRSATVNPAATAFEPNSEAKSPFDFNLPGLAEAPAAQPTPEVSPAWDSPAAPPPMALRPAEEPAFEAPSSSVRDQGVPISISNQVWGVLTQGLRWAADRGIALVSWRLETQLGWPALATLLALGLVIAGARLSLLAWRVGQLRRLTDGSQPAGGELLELFGRLCARGGVRRSVELRVSVRHRSPLVVGFFRPVILLPADLAESAAWLEAEHVLGHELAHVRRYDDWANLIQHFIQAACFFHPAVWWIDKRLSLEREIACDDHVLQQGSGRRNYALILTSVASRIQQRTPMLAPGVSNNNSQLQQRISMILNTRRNSSPSLAKGRLASITSAAALVATLALYTGPRFLLAQTASARSAAVISSGPSSAPAAVGSTGEALSPASAETARFAESAAPAAALAGIDSGPKLKPEIPGEELPGPGEIAPPEAPEPPSVNVNVDVDPKPMRTPRAARTNKPNKEPRTPDDLKDTDRSIEQRLKRLEKMVQSLMSQDKPKNTHGNFAFKEGVDQDFNFDFKDNEKLKESAERQAARAEEQAKRAAEQAKRAMKDLESSARMDQEQQGNRESREAFQHQLEALRKAREGLGQEMERLDRQIQKLEKEKQRGERDQRGEPGQQRRSQTRGDRLQAEVSTTEAQAE